MKKILTLGQLLMTTIVFSQVGIGTPDPHVSSVLDITSTDKGMLPPRLTTAQRDAIAVLPAGLMIYNTTTNCLNFWNATQWVSTCGTTSPGNPEVVLPGNPQAWMRHNLGADTSLDPDVPVKEIHGDYYQWGRIAAVATTDAIIGTWNTTIAPNGSWQNAVKTVNDPCPDGFRIPTMQQWNNMANNTPQSDIGTWSGAGGDPSNFTAAKVFTSGTSKITFPITGIRNSANGNLTNRGTNARYWSTNECTTTSGCAMIFNNGGFGVSDNNRATGLSIRCISE